MLQLCVEYKQNRLKPNNENEPEDEKGKSKQSVTAPKFIMSTQDRDPPIAFHPDGKGLKLQSRDKARWAGCRCAAGISLSSSGKETANGWVGYSYECIVLDEDGIVRVGWSSEDASLQLGTDADGYGWGGTGMVSNSGKYEPFPNKGNKIQFSKDDVVSCHLKLFNSDSAGTNQKDKKKDVAAIISFSKNGELVGEAFEIKRKGQMSFYPTICVKNAECELNFGQDPNKPPKFSLPEGFVALSSLTKTEGSTRVVANPRDARAVQLSQQRNSERQGPLAIVIEPTRDLAEQR